MITGPERTDPPYEGTGREALRAWLDWHRGTLLTKCAGLTEEQLRERAVPPSSMSLLGLLRHLTEVEAGWFLRCTAGEDVAPTYYDDDRPDGDFDDLDSHPVAEVHERYLDVVHRARAAEAVVPTLEAVGAGTRQGRSVTLMWVMVLMIEEYARHNGHADLLRERLDGATGD